MSQIISNLRIQKILAHFEFLQAKLNENLEKRNLIQKSKNENKNDPKRDIKETNTDQKFVSKNQAIIDKLKNS